MENEMFMPFGTQVKEAITKQKKVIVKNITFPVNLFEEFNKYAEETSGDCYWLAIKELLEYKRKGEEVNSELALLLKVIETLDGRIEYLEEEFKKITEKPKHKSFGGNEV